MFVENLFDLDQAAVVKAAQGQRASLKKRPVSADEFLDTLLRQGLVQTVKSLTPFKAIL
jgi:hypothetical protein